LWLKGAEIEEKEPDQKAGNILVKAIGGII
jgi:hypothetical protein